MRRTILLAFALMACAGRSDSRGGADSSGAGRAAPELVRDTALARELHERVTRDQELRDRFAAELRATGIVADTTYRQMMRLDSANIAWLKPILLNGPLPTRRDVGNDGLAAIFLLVQHADQDTSFQAAILPRFEAAYAAGELDGASVALLTDRVMKARTGRQTYGTQAQINDGKVTFDPIDDSANVDARRKKMGLPPLLEYKRVMDSVYGKAPKR